MYRPGLGPNSTRASTPRRCSASATARRPASCASGLQPADIAVEPCDHPPRVQHIGNVTDCRAALADAQHQVVVLAAVEAFTKPADIVQQRPPHHREMVDVVLGEQPVRREVGFECRQTRLAVGEQLVLVGVDHVRIGVVTDVRGHREQRMRAQHIIVIEEPDEIACGQLDRGVRCGGDTTLPVAKTTRTRGSSRRFEHGTNVRLRRCVIRDAQLQVRIRLGEHRVDRSFQPGSLGVVHRHHDADDTRALNSPLRRAACVASSAVAVGVCSASQRRYCRRRAAGCVGNADRAAQLPIAADDSGHRSRTMIDEHERAARPPCAGSAGGATRAVRDAGPCGGRQGDPRRGTARRLGELGPRRLELGLQLGYPPAGGLAARRGAWSISSRGAVIRARARRSRHSHLQVHRTQMVGAARAIRRALSMLELGRDARQLDLELEIPTMTVVAQGSGRLEAIHRPKSVFQRTLNLTRELAITQFKLKYTGSALGYVWSLVKPLMLFGIMYLVFSVLLKTGGKDIDFPVELLLGIVIWTFFIEFDHARDERHRRRRRSDPKGVLPALDPGRRLNGERGCCPSSSTRSLVVVVTLLLGKLHLSWGACSRRSTTSSSSRSCSGFRSCFQRSSSSSETSGTSGRSSRSCSSTDRRSSFPSPSSGSTPSSCATSPG